MPTADAPPKPKQARSLATRLRLLDAAVDELLELGYAQLTTANVAKRAGVSRGAQQHHFPHKASLMSEAVQHLADRQLEEMRRATAKVADGERRVEGVLDAIFQLYSGELFKAMLELTFASRGDELLAELMPPLERWLSDSFFEKADSLFGDDDFAARQDFPDRLRLALSSVRGVALLLLLGYPRRTVTLQWQFARRELAKLLTDSDRPPA